MIYEVTYKNQAGDTLMTVTFPAEGPPTFQPPPGTHDIDISCGDGTGDSEIYKLETPAVVTFATGNIGIHTDRGFIALSKADAIKLQQSLGGVLAAAPVGN